MFFPHRLSNGYRGRVFDAFNHWIGDLWRYTQWTSIGLCCIQFLCPLASLIRVYSFSEVLWITSFCLSILRRRVVGALSPRSTYGNMTIRKESFRLKKIHSFSMLWAGVVWKIFNVQTQNFALASPDVGYLRFFLQQFFWMILCFRDSFKILWEVMLLDICICSYSLMSALKDMGQAKLF